MGEPVSPLRARLVHEATEILAAQGASALTVRRVAEAAGCSTIGIYTHFGGKQGLVEALLVDAHVDFTAAMAAIDVLPAGRGQLLAGAHVYRDWALVNRSRYLVMFAAHLPAFSPGPETVERLGASLRDHAARVAAAMEAGELVAEDPDELAYHIWACVHGYVMLDLFFGREAADAEARRVFDAGVRRVLDGATPR